MRKSVKELRDEVGKNNLEKGLAWLMKVKKVEMLGENVISLKSMNYAEVRIECFYEK